MLASAADWSETGSYQSMGISRAVHGSISVELARRWSCAMCVGSGV